MTSLCCYQPRAHNALPILCSSFFDSHLSPTFQTPVFGAVRNCLPAYVRFPVESSLRRTTLRPTGVYLNVCHTGPFDELAFRSLRTGGPDRRVASKWPRHPTAGAAFPTPDLPPATPGADRHPSRCAHPSLARGHLRRFRPHAEFGGDETARGPQRFERE